MFTYTYEVKLFINFAVVASDEHSDHNRHIHGKRSHDY
jgi:hypothetical protein